MGGDAVEVGLDLLERRVEFGEEFAACGVDQRIVIDISRGFAPKQLKLILDLVGDTLQRCANLPVLEILPCFARGPDRHPHPFGVAFEGGQHLLARRGAHLVAVDEDIGIEVEAAIFRVGRP